MKKAIVLLSGGLDSATTLYIAKKQGFECFCLVFDYGQRHQREIESAIEIAKAARCRLQVVKIALPWKGSSLLDRKIQIPLARSHEPRAMSHEPSAIPSTYVPGRNIIFLSFALSYAEVIKAEAIFIGANARDFSGYPDCRPDFYRAFSRVVKTGAKLGVSGRNIRIITPLINMTKAQIIKTGARLKVPYGLTWSCYRGGSSPCGECDSCKFRSKGFRQAGIEDPLKT